MEIFVGCTFPIVVYVVGSSSWVSSEVYFSYSPRPCWILSVCVSPLAGCS